MQTQKITQSKIRYYNTKPLDFVVCADHQLFYRVLNDRIYKKDKRTKNIERHVKEDDYFGTLSAILSLAHQSNEKSIKEIEKYNKALERFSDDLLFLQDNYRIVKK